MNSEFYRLYRDDTLRLVSSLVIKFNSVADAVNVGLKELGYAVDNEHPETWKYYLHLNGEYHPSDPPIQVRSADTLEDIIFNKENLKTHLATARNYQWGTEDYDKLARQYPDQIDLINGILSPVPFDKAYNAQDGDILNYAKDFVEDQEYDLIPRLQSWLYMYIDRWYNPSYTITDDYYLAAFIGLLYSLLPTVFNTLRLSNCQTERAHTYHIREYLRSNGRLDRYIPYLNIQQRLWLYRNIRYLVRNAGKQATFEDLIYHILTVRNIPVVSYTLDHDYAGFPANLYPDVVMQKHPRNKVGLGAGNTVESVDSILDKQKGIAPYNDVVQDLCRQKAKRGMATSAYSRLTTKVLESEAVDHSDSGVAILANTLMNHWVYMGYTGQYRAYVTVSNPITGERLTLTMRDAFVMMWYCRFKSWGRTVTELPCFTAFDVQRPKPATIDELRPYVDWRDVTDGELVDLQRHFVPYGEIISIENFYDTCVDIHNGIVNSWQYVCSKEHLYTYTYLRQARLRNYMNVVVDFRNDSPSYEQWFRDRNIDLSSLDREDYATLMRELIANSTGSSLQKTVSFAELQERLLELLQKLCSYSVQFLQTISFTNFFVVGATFPRLIDYRTETKGTVMEINIPNVDVIDVGISAQATSKGMRFFKGIEPKGRCQTFAKHQLPVASDISVSKGDNVQRFTLNTPIITVNDAHITVTDATTKRPVTDRQRYKALYTDYGPGPSVLHYGDISQGYFGSVNAEEFILPDQLKEKLGIVQGNTPKELVRFHKFYLNSEVVYIPDHDFFTDIDIDEFIEKCLLHGTEITLGSHKFTLKAPNLTPDGKGVYRVDTKTDGSKVVSINGFTASENGLTECELTQTLLTVASDLKDSTVNNVPIEIIDNQPTLDELHLPWTGQSVNDDAPCLVGGDTITYVHHYADTYGIDDIRFEGITLGGMMRNEETDTMSFTHCVTLLRSKTMHRLSYRPMFVLKK